MIEPPEWFKHTSFHTFATWIAASLEENLWAQYVSFIFKYIIYSYNY